MKTNKMKDEKLMVKGILLSIFIFQFSICQAQQDSALNRSVTVERDFQPIIQAAGKVSTRPAVVETTIEPAPVEYSSYTASVTPEGSINPMLSQPTRFEAGKPFDGYIRGGLGHPNTLFDFGYHLDDGKNSLLDVYAHHKAEWGLATLSKTKIGLDFTHPFSTCNLYFGLSGGNLYYHKYGHFYDYSATHGMWEHNKTAYSNLRPLTERDKTALWTVEAFIGVKANAKQDFQYKVQTGYMLFAKPGAVSEHQIRTLADFDWHSDAHHVGGNIYVQNNLLQLRSLAEVIPDSVYSHCHDIRIEPYYEYQGKRIRIHVGVDLGVNIGSVKNSLSGLEGVSFAPAPNIRLEAQVAKEWLTIYANITGDHGSGSLQAFMEENRYSLIHQGILDHHFSYYTPVDAELGFHIRPYRDLLIEIHGGYAYMMSAANLIAHADSATFAPLNKKLFGAGDFGFFYTNYQKGKIGAQINYHLRDALRINLHGDYYFWYNDFGTVLDRPNWEMGLRIDGRIDKHWSLYSDNYFCGTRTAQVYNEATDLYSYHTLRPTVDLNLGLQYDMWVGKVKGERRTAKGERQDEGQVLRPEPKPNLSLFFQLNNWLHRKNEIYYGYRSQGINFVLGATYRF